MKSKDRFGMWFCYWIWLAEMILAVLSFGYLYQLNWAYRLMDWLEDHGFEVSEI